MKLLQTYFQVKDPISPALRWQLVRKQSDFLTVPSLKSIAAYSPRKSEAAKLLTSEILCGRTNVPKHEQSIMSKLRDNRQQVSNLCVLVLLWCRLPQLSHLVCRETLQTHSRTSKTWPPLSSAFTNQKRLQHE